MLTSCTRLFVPFLLFSLIAGCAQDPAFSPASRLPIAKNYSESHLSWTEARILERKISLAESVFRDSGMVNVQSIIPEIAVELRYSTTNNLTRTDFYQDIQNAYLQPEVAQMLKTAFDFLKDTLPGYNLLILDAARPLWAQQIIWDSTKIPLNLKTRYLSNPKNHSIHNYGAAVDITILDDQGRELDMGTPFDFFGAEAQPIRESEMLKAGKLTAEQIRNRSLLRTVMKEAGFRHFPYEWWHFNAFSREEARRRYKMIP